MSKEPTEPGDWSRAAEAALRASTADHAPNQADRARVRSAIARRLASGPPVDDAWTDLAGTTVSRVGAGNVVKLGIGVACVLIGTFTLTYMRGTRTDGPRARDATPGSMGASSTNSEGAAQQEPVEPRPSTAPAPALARELLVERAERALPRGRERRTTRERTKGTSDAPAVRSPQAVKRDSTAATMPSIADGPDTDGDTPARATDEANPEREPRTENSAPPAAAPPSKNPRTNEPSSDGSNADARAELAFLMRIKRAIARADFHVVLDLCVEHERRWPQGTFVQEREALRAIASCKAATDDAGARARAFIANYSRGPLAPRVRKQCDLQLTSADERH